MSKTGFKYYNIDTDRYQDIRIKRLKRDFGCIGISVYDYILCEIYRVNGCFLEWDENTAFDVAEYFGLKDNQVKEVVNYCCAVGLFNQVVLTNENILTSLSIQQRYIDMCKRAKRVSPFEIPENIKLIPEEHEKLPEELPETTEEFNRVDKSRINKNISISISEKDRENFFEILFFEKKILFPQKELERFLNHYSKTGWLDKNGNNITNRCAALKNWKVTPDSQSSIKLSDWEKFYKGFKEVYPNEDLSFFLTDIKDIQVDVKYVTFILSDQLRIFLENNIEILAKQFKNTYPDKTLKYIIWKN